ncbi:MAG TPA: type II toxin-antitoxin system VapB family antitoxin [Planctomycetota bacterium]|nr:type II toxin-antitoxin system VapB family antitoxin [Planctomycetota bacterium]
MTIQLTLDDKLINELQQLEGGNKSTEEAVSLALTEYIKLKKRIGIFELVGKVEYDDDINPRMLRGKT